MNRAGLSVLMPNFNHARYLPAALEAVLDQSRAPSEVIVMDDASTDGSCELVGSYERRDSRVRLIRNEVNRGVIPNLNRLLSEARADYVYFAAADDFILPGFFATSLALLANHPGAAMSSSLSFVLDEATDEYLERIVPRYVVSSTPRYINPQEARRILVTRGGWFQGNTTIYRRAALEDAGGFPEELKPFCDGFISLVLAARHGSCFTPEPLCVWRRAATTYAERARRDPAAVRTIVTAAQRLARERFPGELPDRFLSRWRREVLLDSARVSWSAVQAEQRRFLEDVGAADPGGSVARAGRIGLGALTRAFNLAMLGGLVIRYFPPHVLRALLHQRTTSRRIYKAPRTPQ